MKDARLDRHRRKIAFSVVASLLAAPPAAAAEKTKERVWGEARPDAALVYFVREALLAGSGRTAFVFADQMFLGVLDNDSYTFAHAEPGRHVLWANATTIHAEAEWLAGRTYHYLYRFDRFQPLEPDEGRRLVEEAKRYATATPAETRKAAEHVAERFEKAKERLAETHFEVPPVPTPPRPHDVAGLLRIPAETPVNLVLAQNVTSYRNQPGDPVWFRIAADVVADRTVALRRGSWVKGVVRRAGRAKGGAVGGILDLVIPGVPSDGGLVVPVVGQVAGGGDDRPGKQMAVGVPVLIVGGLLLGTLALGMVKGDEAFELAGSTTTVWTRDEVFIPPAVAPTMSDSRGSCQEAAAVARTRFRPHLRGDLDDVVLKFAGPHPDGELAIMVVDGEALVEPVVASEVRQEEAGGWSAVFDGWEVIRFLGPREKETTFRLELRVGRGADRCFAATLVLRLDDRRED